MVVYEYVANGKLRGMGLNKFYPNGEYSYDPTINPDEPSDFFGDDDDDEDNEEPFDLEDL